MIYLFVQSTIKIMLHLKVYITYALLPPDLFHINFNLFLDLNYFGMSAASTESEDEVPSLLWGLNPIFSCFARLYIKDILEMKESKQVPGK